MADPLFPDSIRSRLSALFRDAFASLGASPDLGEVVPSQKPELGDFQCNGAMAASKALKKNPREIAQAIVEAVGTNLQVREMTIAGPGFINIRLKEEWLAAMNEVAAKDARLGLTRVAERRRVVFDFGGPNVAKPMHVGHLRSSIIGDSLQRLFRFVGHDVISDIHLGDWGTQMGMLIEAVRRERPDLSAYFSDTSAPTGGDAPFSIDDLQRWYPAASALCKENPEELAKAQKATAELQAGHQGYRALWRHFVDVSIRELKEDFHNLGVDFDEWFGESHYHDAIPPMVDDLKARGIAVEDQGALIIPVVEPTDQKEVPPLLLVKSDGGYLYATTDLATIQQRVCEFQADDVLYVVDKRQGLHFEQVFRAARRSGIAGTTNLEHLAFGTMNGPDGKPFKTRAGGVMRLTELMVMMRTEALDRMKESGIAEDYGDDEKKEIARRVGLASLKYADLQNPRANDYIFDPEKFTRFEGRTGAYLCYAAVRIKSILRNAESRGFQPGAILPAAPGPERALQLQLLLLPDAITWALESRMPHHLCAYVYELSQGFNQFYSACHILSEEDANRRASWLGLCVLTKNTLELVLDLLGIETPERM